MRRVFATAQDAEAAFYEALEKADLEAMMEVWSEDDEVVCIHPGGPRLAGYDQVRESWTRIFASGQRLAVRLTNTVHMLSGMIAVHSVHENIAVPDDRTNAIAVATNVFIRTSSGWRMLVHHSSPAAAVVQGRVPAAGGEGSQTLH